MRMTQWIGLNAAAVEFVSRCLDITRNEPKRVTFGMFDEELPLSTWHNLDTNEYYKEVVQCEPWSSGPMIFTYLEDADGNKLFQWIQDIEVRGQEYDFTTNRMWV